MGIMRNIIGTVRIGFITATDSGITTGDIGPTGTASTFFSRSTNRRATAGQQAQGAEFSGYAENVFLARNMRVDAYGIQDLRASFATFSRVQSRGPVIPDLDLAGAIW